MIDASALLTWFAASGVIDVQHAFGRGNQLLTRQHAANDQPSILAKKALDNSLSHSVAGAVRRLDRYLRAILRGRANVRKDGDDLALGKANAIFARRQDSHILGRPVGRANEMVSELRRVEHKMDDLASARAHLVQRRGQIVGDRLLIV